MHEIVAADVWRHDTLLAQLAAISIVQQLCMLGGGSADWQAGEQRCASAAAAYPQHLANSTGSGVKHAARFAAAAETPLQISVLAAPRSRGGAGYLQQSVASTLYGV